MYHHEKVSKGVQCLFRQFDGGRKTGQHWGGCLRQCFGKQRLRQPRCFTTGEGGRYHFLRCCHFQQGRGCQQCPHTWNEKPLQHCLQWGRLRWGPFTFTNYKKVRVASGFGLSGCFIGNRLVPTVIRRGSANRILVLTCVGGRSLGGALRANCA